MKKKYLFLTIFILCLLSSIILSIGDVPAFCDVTEGCNTVQHSTYAYFLGIKDSVYGVFIFSFLTLLSALQIKNPTKGKEKIISYSIIFGSIIALYFLYLQIYVLEAYCKYCLIVDISLLVGLVLLFWKRH